MLLVPLQAFVADPPASGLDIGYNLNYPDKHFDAIREEINKQEDWIVAYDGAQYFRDTGMLVDITHYSEEGCQLVTRALARAVLLVPDIK